MISRFQGDEGKKRLITALRAQQIVQDEEPLAAELADAVQLIQVEPGTPGSELIRQGGTDNEIYLIITGLVSIRINGREVATRSAGTHVGEMALIDPAARRNATVIVTQSTLFGRITEPVFSAIAQRYPQLWRRLALELANRLRQRSALVPVPNDKPFLFIGSSVESLPIARELQSALSHDPLLATVWTDGVFRASRTSIENLITTVAKSDFALLVLTPDDTVTSRDETKAVPRDNCIFELGLFMGALGPERTVIVKPRGEDIKMPSDLLGVTPLDYTPGTPDTLAARLGPVCHDIRKIVASLGPK
jgi:CRP/FNR family transcriptional regulator, cyclic AMP receptor protein